ncbi:hypothetical protein QE152_g39238 [Popillia japonica]|uniref:Uncharacterized protein n=1 Tax=Popillia japonica TaxID=7064 RepID=A0AAW1HUF9_POPJA
MASTSAASASTSAAPTTSVTTYMEVMEISRNIDELPQHLQRWGLIPTEESYKCPKCGNSLRLERAPEKPQIRQLMKDTDDVERLTWQSSVAVAQNFLGNHKADNYVELVEEMLVRFKDLGCNMSIKLDYLNSQLITM